MNCELAKKKKEEKKKEKALFVAKVAIWLMGSNII